MPQIAPRAPYSLAPIAFPFPALAALAGHAPLGGPREVALACFLAARLVADSRHEKGLSPEQLDDRAAGARHWVGAATIPAGVRAALASLLDGVATGDRARIAAAFESVMIVTANQLDAGARLELGRLAQAIAV